jgi:hypothetical protein
VAACSACGGLAASSRKRAGTQLAAAKALRAKNTEQSREQLQWADVCTRHGNLTTPVPGHCRRTHSRSWEGFKCSTCDQNTWTHVHTCAQVLQVGTQLQQGLMQAKMYAHVPKRPDTSDCRRAKSSLLNQHRVDYTCCRPARTQPKPTCCPL